MTPPPSAPTAAAGGVTAFVLGCETYIASLRRFLAREGWSVSGFEDPRSLVDAIAVRAPDIVVVDLEGAAHPGSRLVEGLRHQGYEGGLVLLKAGATELEIVACLDAGADDCVPKEVGVSELGARLRAVLRRAAPLSVAAGAELRIDRAARRVWSGQRELDLNAREFEVLLVLAECRGRAVRRDELLDAWPDAAPAHPRSLDRTVARLRQKLREADTAGDVIAVRGLGFRLDDRELSAG